MRTSGAFTRSAVLVTTALLIAGAGPVATPSVQEQEPTRLTNPPPVAPAVLRPDPIARMVQLDAVVTDRQGRPLLDLKASDFEVVEGGVLQRLDAVELRTHSDAATQAAPVETPEDEERAAREPGTRVFAILLDEFHVSPGEHTERVRSAVLKFLADQIRADDLVAVLKPLDPVTQIRFRRGAAEAREAAAAFSGRKGDYEARTDFEQRYIGRAPAAVRAARAQIVFSGLRALTLRMGELGAGRAALVLVTEGPGRPAGRDGDIQALVRAASRARAAVYTLDPSLAAAPQDEAEAASWERTRGLLRSLSSQTGGEMVSAPADLDAAFRRVARELEAYYLLSYTSSHAGDGRFYEVQIRSRRPDANVRSRSGYWAPIRTDLMLGSDRRPAAPMRAIRRSPLIETWLGLNVVNGTQQVTLTWSAAPRRVRTPIGQQPSVVAVKVTTPEGATLYEGELSAVRQGGSSGREESARFDALPGPIQFDLVVFAADGTRLDTAAQDLTVPDLARADPVILPPQVLRSSSARDFRVLSQDPEAAPVPEREFRRTERLLLRIPTHSASSTPVSLDVRVLNRSGQVLRTLQPMGSGEQEVRQFDLPLAWLAPGDYSVELVATSARGSAKELIRFRVTG